MAAQNKPGRDRLDLKVEPELHAAVIRAAEQAGKTPVSAWVRQAIMQRLERDGVEIEAEKRKGK